MSTMHRPSSTKTLTALLPGGILPHLLLLCSVTATFPVLAQAADFAGDLDQVKITDAAGTNQPPVAAFTFTQNGETYTFDASGSTDPDGSITIYKWTYPDGTTAEGATATFTTAETTKFPVTLTVVDNNGGAALNQQQIVPTAEGIADDFSTDTSSMYTVVTGKPLNVASGALHTQTWSTTVAYHNKSLGSNDHSIEADVVYAPEYGGGLLARYNPQANTGYLVFFESGRVSLRKFANGSATYLSQYVGNYAAGSYRLKLAVTGNTISVSVNGAVVLTTTDSTYSSGSYAGVRLRTGADAASIYVDNLQGK